MRKKFLSAILCILLLVLFGCGRETKPQESGEQSEYYENSLVFRLPDNHCPFTLIGVSDTHLYYWHRELVGSGEEYGENIAFYRQALEKGSEPVRMELPSENLLLRSSRIFTDSEGQDSIYLLLGEEKDGKLSYSLAGYDMEGSLLEEVALQDSKTAGDYPESFLKRQDGSFAVITKKYFFVADSGGETQFSLPCPGAQFRGLVEISEDKVGVSYAEENDKNVKFAIVDCSAGTISGKVPITGDGSHLCLGQGTVVYVDETAICQYDLTTAATSRVVSLEGRNIDTYQIVDMRTSGNAFHLFGYSTDMNAAKYITYTTEMEDESTGGEEGSLPDPEKYDAYGRRYIYLYDFSGNWPKDSTNPIDAFNEQSDRYQVVLKDYQYGDTYGYDVAKIVASGDYPDLIFSTYNSLIASLQEKGVLEDLTSYIGSSENLSLEDLPESIVAAYTDQGRLFALPNNYSLGAFWGDREQLGEAGWTVDEFLDWLAEDPNAGAPQVGTRKDIYNACIPTVLDMCIDEENGQASFDGEAFRSFITKLKALNRKDSYTREEAIQMMEEMEGSAYYLSDQINLTTIGREESTRGRELVIKGYPSVDGQPLAYINSPALSIMSTSEVKEGAYEFLEFYVLYMNDTIAQIMDKIGGLWTVERYLEQNREALLLADPDAGAPCTYSERQLDEVTDFIQYAVLRDYSRKDLEELIWEELGSFFEGQKDADTVCGIIQSRVQLYLQEHDAK